MKHRTTQTPARGGPLGVPPLGAFVVLGGFIAVVFAMMLVR